MFHFRSRGVNKLKRAPRSNKSGLGDQFESEIWADIISKVRPRWPKLMTIWLGRTSDRANSYGLKNKKATLTPLGDTIEAVESSVTGGAFFCLPSPDSESLQGPVSFFNTTKVTTD